MGDRHWWHSATVYEVYPSSFKYVMPIASRLNPATQTEGSPEYHRTARRADAFLTETPTTTVRATS